MAVAAPLQKLLQQTMSSDPDVGPSGDEAVAASAPVDAPAAAAVEGEEAGEETEQKQSSSSAQDAWAWRAHMSRLVEAFNAAAVSVNAWMKAHLPKGWCVRIRAWRARLGDALLLHAVRCGLLSFAVLFLGCTVSGCPHCVRFIYHFHRL